MGELVSVIIPCYNAAPYLAQAVRSALVQRGVPGVEVIVVDDGSTDASWSVAIQLATEDPRVRPISAPHGGVCAAVNQGLAAARGEFVALCGADDWWHPDKLGLQLAALRAGRGPILVYSDMEVVDASGRMVHPSFWRWAGIEPHAGQPIEQLLRRNFISGGTILFRRRDLDWALPIPEALPYEDWWLAMSASLAGGVDYDPRPLTFYRFHGSNAILGRGRPRTLQQTAKQIQHMLAYYEGFARLLEVAETRWPAPGHRSGAAEWRATVERVIESLASRLESLVG